MMSLFGFKKANANFRVYDWIIFPVIIICLPYYMFGNNHFLRSHVGRHIFMAIFQDHNVNIHQAQTVKE